MTRSVTPRRTFSRAGAIILALLAAGLALPRGGVDLWAETAGLALAVAALLASTASQTVLPPSAFAFLAVLGVASLQLVPVPAEFHVLSPGARRIFEVSLAPIGLYPATRPLSLDPAGSARGLLRAITCTAAFVAAWRYADSRRRRNWIVRGLAGASVAATLVVLGAALFGLGDLLPPRFPFRNPNHLAGFLNLTAFAALALAVHARGHARVLWGLAFISAAGVVFLSLSRAGIGAFFFGFGVFFLLRWAQPEPEGKPRANRLVALVAILGLAMCLGAFLALEPVLAELRTLRGISSDLKVRLLVPALALVRDFPLLGTGPGAFVTVFRAYQSESSSLTFTHVENEWLQAVIDLGLPAGLLLVGTFAWLWTSVARRRDLGTVETGLLAGTAAVASNNVFDFSLDVLGVALPFAIAMGLLARSQRQITVRPWLFRAGVGALVLIGAASAAVAAVHDLDRDRDLVESARSASGASGAARNALLWHPADWIPHASAGIRTAKDVGCRSAMPWLLRAMALDPLSPEPHFAAARCLVGRNDGAAKREYRLAEIYGLPALAEAVKAYPALDDLLEIAPMTPDGLLALGRVLVNVSRPDDASIVFERALLEFGESRALLPLALAKASAHDNPAALDLARRHAQAFPGDPDGWLVGARALAALGREDDARVEIERGLAASPGSYRLLAYLSDRAMASKRWSEAKRAAEEIIPRSATEVAGKHLLSARALAGQGRLSEATDRAKSAASADESTPLPWEFVANYAEAAGRYEEAIEALRHAATLPGAPADGYAPRIADIQRQREVRRNRALERRELSGLEGVPR
jgi:O-antigen ligase